MPPEAETGGRRALFLRAALGAVISAVLFFMMALTVVDVFGRYFLSKPVPGSFEMMEFSLAILVFSAMPLVTWDRSHITVTLFDSLFRGAARSVQQVLVLGVSTLAMGIICWRLVDQGNRLDSTGAITGYLEWPIAPVAYFMAAFAGLATAILLHLTFLAVRGRPAPDHRGHEPEMGE